MPMQLVVVAGPDKGRTFPLTPGGAFFIGRGGQSHSRLLDPAVSRVHCEVRVEGAKAIVTDAKSASGTFVNKQRITTHELRVGDVIQVGDTLLRFDHDLVETATVLPGTQPAAPVPAQPTPPPAPKGVVFANKPGARALPRPIKDLLDLVGKPFGGYQILELVGTGQIGVVFKARDTKDQKLVALKVLRSDFARDDKAMQRFVRGMMTVRILSHPHLIELYNAGNNGAHAWIAMEFIDGSSLAELMRQPGRKRDWREAWRVALHVSRALDFMHKGGLIHRGVMPQNILVQKSDQVAKLGDAMLAKAIEDNAAQEVTASGELVGNVYYIAPERTIKGTEVDGRIDIYSLGVTVYTLVAGRMPFEGTSMPEVLMKIRSASPPSLRDFDATIPDSFNAIVSKMLAKLPDGRYATAEALVGELARHGGGPN